MSILRDSVTLDRPRKLPVLSVSKKMKETFRRGTVGLFGRKRVTNVFGTDEPAFTMSDLNIDGVEPAFLKNCLSHVINPRTQAGIRSPLSSSSSLVSPTALNLKVDQTHLTKNYTDAYTDTYGLFSGAPFIFKTGAAWPKAMDGPNAQPFLRELRPIGNHPILSAWDGILTDAGAYLKGVGNMFSAVMALGFANIGEETAFCPLVVILGVEPETIEFEVAKSVAKYVKINIIAKAGFDDIEVAIWEFTTSFSAAGPRLPFLDPELDRVANFRHPFASTLGIPIAPLKRTRHEGTLGMFMTRGDGKELLGITAAHVVCPSRLFPGNKGLSEKSAELHHEDIIALGSGAYEDAVKQIETQIGNLQKGIASEEQRIKGLRGRLERGVVDTDGRITSRIEDAQQTVESAKRTIKELNLLHSNVTKYMAIADNRCIGRILFADPIGVSSDGPDGYTRDWAVLKMRKDTFGEDFQGNKIYIGDELDEATFLERMFPQITDCEGYGYPEHGLLQLRGVVPESELISFKQLDVNGDPALTVVKNGRSSGTTIGSVSSLKSLVRNYKTLGTPFWSRELTIVPYHGARSPFSKRGDSGSIIADRSGRIVALLTGGGGVTDAVDVTFATPYCQLEKRIKEALPGIRLLD